MNIRRLMMIVSAKTRRLIRGEPVRVFTVLSGMLKSIGNAVRSAVFAVVSAYGAARIAAASRIRGNIEMTTALEALLEHTGAGLSGEADATVEITAVIDTSGNVIEGHIDHIFSCSADVVTGAEMRSVPVIFNVAIGAFAKTCTVHNADAPDVIVHVMTTAAAAISGIRFSDSSVETTSFVSGVIAACGNSIAGLATFVYLMNATGNASISDNVSSSDISTDTAASGDAVGSANTASGSTGAASSVSGTMALANEWEYPQNAGSNNEGLLITQVYSAAENGGGITIS